MNTKVPGAKKPLRIRLLGAPEASLEEGHPLRFGTKKSLALLCYLSAEGGRHPRRELAELLWPESDEQHARTDLRSALARLRKTLGEYPYARGDTQEQPGVREGARYLLIDRELLGVEPGGIELDLKALEAAVWLARTETSSAPPGERNAEADSALGRRELIDRLRGNLELYGGEFMEGFTLEDAPEFELWVEAERTRWRRNFGELCERLCRLQSEAGQHDEAIESARVWARHAPLEEDAHRRLMEMLSGAGDSEGALLAYEDFQNTLRRVLKTEPSPQMQELSGRLQEEVEARSSLGASLTHSATTTALSVFEVPLVGRHEEFGTLVSEYHAASMGQTRVAVVLGEAGIGKTRLAEEFLAWASAREADVLKGGASERAGLPYGPVVEAIRPRIERERAPDDLLEDVWLSELSRLLPELKERYPDLPPPTSGEREMAKGALFEAVARTVGTLASLAPVVLFLDDLHWADAATPEVLEYASKRWVEQGAPVLVLIAARAEEAETGSAFEGWLSSLGRRLPVRSLTLGPLADGDVKGLLGRLRSRAHSKFSPAPAGALEEPEEEQGVSNGAEHPWLESFGERLALETGGQPFYLVETLKALLEEEALVIGSRTAGEKAVVEVGPSLRAQESDLRELLPTSVREVIRSRLSRLSAAGSKLLRAGAVLERGFDFETVVGVAGLREAEGLSAQDELIERRLLREEVGGGAGELLVYASPTYSFSHEKIRQVAYTDAGGARRRVLHRRAFEVLEEGGAPAAQLARHALAGGLAQQAFGYLVAAGDQAMDVFAPRNAIEHYERAHSLLAKEEEVRTGGGGLLVEASIANLEHLYIQLGRAYEMADESGKARAAYEALLALGRQLGEARLEVISLNNLAILTFHLQETEPARARTLLEEARGVAEEAGLEEALVETECNLADVMAYFAGEFEHSRPLAEMALASARALGEERPDLIARALWTLARVENFRGRLEESAAYAKEGAVLSRELAERPPPRRLFPSMLTAMGLAASWRADTKAMEMHCLLILAFGRIMQGRLQEGIRVAREALSISRELPEGAEALDLAVLGLGLVDIGEYEEGLELCRQGTEMSRKAQNALFLWYNLDHLGQAYEALLELEEARRVHEEALELGGQVGPQYEAWSSARLCAVAALSEDWEDAYAHAKRAHQVRTSLDVREGIYLYHEVEALLRGGDERSAREEARRLAERVEANERERIAYLRSLAVLSESEGDTLWAIDRLQEAEALAEKIGLPKELWQIRSKVGELYVRRGETREAREAFSRAAHTLRMLAQKIGDEELREGFLVAPQARRVLERS